jgi:Tol biopolymer transport system component
MRKRILELMPVLACLTLVLATAEAAYATFPGQNGLIAFTQGDFFNGIPAQVFTAKPDGANQDQVQLPEGIDVEEFSIPVWSPDGSRLLISHTFRLDNTGQCCLPFRPAIVKPDGSEFNLLTITYGPFDMDCGTWSLDQTRILCGFGGDEPGIFSVRASDGGDPVRLTTNPYAANDFPADISPDGTQFLFLRFKPGASPGPRPFQTQQVALFVENIDGTGLRQITPYGLAAPHEVAGASWSPDGTEIITEMKNGRLFVVRTDGTGLSMIHLQTGTTRYFAFQPHWSPDGTRILFCMFINGGEGIYTANPAGSDVKKVTFTMDSANIYNGPNWGTHTVSQ